MTIARIIASIGTVAIAVAALPAPASTEPASSPVLLVQRAIDQVKVKAYRSHAVDWPRLEAQVLTEARKAKDAVDALASLQLLLDGLGDGHSFVQASPEYSAAFKARHGRNYWEGKPAKTITSQFTGRKEISGRTLVLSGGSKARLIVVPKMMGGGETARLYAETLFSQVAEAVPMSCGYVVDLRGNIGGNVWPMVTGLGALIGDGPGSRELYADGRKTSFARLDKGAAIVNEGPQKDQEIVRITNWRALPALTETPLAVLVDDAVGSSGEGTAIQLKGRSNTRFFGQKTAAVATSNEGMQISDDINLVVTTAMMMDRNGTTYPEGIIPDQVVPAGEGSALDPDDAVVEEAKAWLARQKGCAPTESLAPAKAGAQ